MRVNLRTLRTVAAAVTVAVPMAAVIGITIAAPARATGGDCHTVKVTSSQSVTASGGGEATITAAGLILSTPEQASKVSYRRALGAPVPFSKINTLSYVADRQAEATGNDQVIAAYKLGVDANSDNTIDGVLVFEPLYSGTVSADEQTHDALAGKWWYSAEPGNKQTLATFEQWTQGTGPVAFPAPEVRWFGVEQGTWNTGAVTLVKSLRFAAAGVCKSVTFCPPPSNPPSNPPSSGPPSDDPTPPDDDNPSSPPASDPPSSDPDDDPSEEPTQTPPPIDDEPTGGSLPLTGAPVAGAAVVGAVLLAGGAVALYLARRRRARYVP